MKSSKNLLQDLDEAWLTEYTSEEPAYNPLDILRTQDDDDFEKKLAWLLTQPDFFSFTCKHIFNVELLPFQDVILKELWNRKYPMYIATRGAGKTWLLSLYALLRALIIPNRKIIIAGASFRQSKFLHEYMENIWRNAPVLRDLCDNDSGPLRAPDVCKFIINNSIIQALPIGDGSKIRGYRAHDLIVDEFASHDRAIFETVLAGFGNVAANTVESVKLQASKKKAKNAKLNDESLYRDNLLVKPNQIVISGTAYYDFHFFADYWKKWKQIIMSRGDSKRIMEIFKGDIPEDFDYRDYSVIRLPYELIPKGFMDDANIARSRASVHSGIFEMEYGAVFAKDSKGFFKRSLIDSCVANELNNITLPSGKVVFDAMLSGDKTKKYIIAIDPASEVDNFAVVIIEINADHRRVVHCWTINRAAHIERVSLGLAKEDNYYSYCARKIRDLMKVFPTERIMLDSQGGGIAVMEAMHDLSILQENEVPIWPVIDDKKYKESDSKSGMHIIEMVNFASAEWTSEANHGLRKDMEDKILLFPKFDPIILALAAEQDKINNKNYDTLEDCVTEIEALKDELVLIEITQTSNGRDRWDTPETKTANNKKGRMRKDRYSALIMANMGARQLRINNDLDNLGYGGFSRKSHNKEEVKVDYVGPAWFTEAMQNAYSAY